MRGWPTSWSIPVRSWRRRRPASLPTPSSSGGSASASCSWGCASRGTSVDEVEASLDELALLVDTAGADVVARIVQRRDRPDPATYRRQGQGRGAAPVCRTRRRRHRGVRRGAVAGPAAQPEKILGRTAIDRTAVILDIFAQNARSPEGKAQVELALLRYRLPRLRGRGRSFSQQAGGIGTRGPGETQLEVDRRRLVRRMQRLEADLTPAERTRRTQRRPAPAVAQRERVARRLHQRRQVDPAQPADRGRRAGREPAVLHARPPHPSAGPARRRDGAAHRHRRVRAQAAAPAGRGVPLHPRGRSAWPTCWSTWWTARPRIPRPDRRRCGRCSARSAPATSPSWWWSTRSTGCRAPREAEATGRPRGGDGLGATGEGIDGLLTRHGRPGAGQRPRRGAR